VDALPQAWVRAVEGWEVVDAIARDLHSERFDPPWQDGGVPPAWEERYPG
jgi:hypothetical protein